MKKPKQPTVNEFGDEITAHIHAIYRNGVFLDLYSGKPVQLRGGVDYGIPVRITVPLSSLPEEHYQDHQTFSRRKILFAGSVLDLKMEYSGGGRLFEFKILLIDDLYEKWRGKKFSRLLPCRFEIIEAIRTSDNTPLEDCLGLAFDSLNQVFTQLSVRLRPTNRTHTCNVFKMFHHKGKLLDELRYRS